MADSGWDIAMRRIDLEYDLPQFVAASLVRKIAANGFRLPPPDRARLPKIPDAVITHIEQMVREAYRDAGEDISGAALREQLEQQALAARRAMVASREVLTLADFGKQIGVSDEQLAKLIGEGSLFAVEFDGGTYVPSLLAQRGHNQERLQTICRIIVPAKPISRWDFLGSKNANLGGRSPLDMLSNGRDFKTLREVAAAWASVWSRTSVKAYAGLHKFSPSVVPPLYTAVAEIDPRRPLWERASEALLVHGYHWPLGPYPDVRSFTLFVERQTIGDKTPRPEACVQIEVEGESIEIRVMATPGTVLQSTRVPAGIHKTLIDIAKRVIAHLVVLSARH
ncbi:hypothetical protein [Paraburkholderia strydomiana]|uniref:Antitoxin Xre/MbcA/ParS-like toxin-binding domain-containing protein n=1 Tax=Paraburkholderia strydomiana TaxID=1245417 RepID=A0ABW9C9K2_9BURK